MASKEVMLALFGGSRWRAPALALMAALILPVCFAAQDSAAERPSAALRAGSNNRATQAISVEQTLTQVRVLYAAGRFAAALEPLETYLASDPRNTVMRLEYARTLAILRRFPEAAREYRRVLETEPQNAAALIGVAKVASWQGQNQLALETYDRVLARHPTLYDALVGKGFVLLWMGRQEEARALFDEARQQYPNDPEVREALSSLGPPTSSPMRASAAAHASQAAASDAKKPAASDVSRAAPAEMPEPAPVEASRPAARPATKVDGQAEGGTAKGPIATPASAPGWPQVTQKPERSSALPHSRGTHKRSGGTAAAIQQGPRPAPRPSGSPSPLRITLATAVQLAMLGMVAVVVGAIAYRTYHVRLSSAPLLPRRVFELPPSSLVPRLRPAATRAGKEGPLAGRVLVVHPQEAVRDFARKVLAGAGAEVLALGRGEDAVVRLEKSPYDAIVVSDQLPAGWSGREIYRWLERNQPGAERKFVLALTDETDAELQSFLEESRALAISMPFGVSDLLAMTRLAMGRSRAQA